MPNCDLKTRTKSLPLPRRRNLKTQKKITPSPLKRPENGYLKENGCESRKPRHFSHNCFLNLICK